MLLIGKKKVEATKLKVKMLTKVEATMLMESSLCVDDELLELLNKSMTMAYQ